MKKNNKRLIIFFLVFATHLFLLFFLNYRSISVNQMFISNGLYSNWSVQLNDEEWDKASMMQQEARIFVEHTPNGNIRTFKSSGDWTPPLIEGKFFSSDTQEAVAVVGRRLLPEEGEPFVFEGQEFEVIGTLGAGFPSILDHLVLLNDTGQNFLIERVVIDADSRQAIESIVFDVDYHPVFSQTELMQFASRWRFGRDLFEEMMIINTGIITFIFLIMSSHAYMTMTKENNSILHLQGFTRKEIKVGNHVTLLIICFISFVATFVVDLILGNQVLFQNSTLYLGIFILQHLLYFLTTTYDELRRRGRHVA